MTSEEHTARHVALHRALDELVADFFYHHPPHLTFLNLPILELMRWSHRQTMGAEEPPSDLHRHA